MAAGSRKSNHTLMGRLAAVAAALVLAACGGGGGGDEPAPAPTPNVTPASGGRVSSSDNKVELVVPANSANASGVITLTPATPDAATTADPDYVAGSSYIYNGPALTFSDPATLTLAGPTAAGSSVLERKRALNFGRTAVSGAEGIWPDRMCVPAYAAGLGLSPHNTWVEGPCPQECDQGARETSLDGFHEYNHCIVPSGLKFVTAPQTCPSGYSDVTANYSDVPLPTSLRVCQALPTISIPSIAINGAFRPGCATVPGGTACRLTSIPSGARIAFFRDTTPPAATLQVQIPAGSPVRYLSTPPKLLFEVTVDAGATVPVTFVYTGTDTVGLRNVEFRELTGLNVFNGTTSSNLLAQATTSGSLPAGVVAAPANSNDRKVVVNFSDSDPPYRYFYVRAIDRGGNVASSQLLRMGRVAGSGPTIASFTATPSTLPPTGGNVTLAWSINGATAASISPTVGTVSATAGSQTVAVTQTTTFTLTASNVNGPATQAVTVSVTPDTTPPSVSLSASSQNVITPGSTTLTASATDNSEVARVDFYEGATLLASRTVAPYTLGINYTSSDAGTHAYTAKAFDAANNSSTSTALTVLVSLPSSADRFVNPASGSDAASGLAAATAYKTLTKAFATVGTGGTVWLANGTYTAANEGLNTGVSTLLAVPAGRTVRASSDGQAVLNFGLSFTANGSAVGLAFDGLAPSAGMTGIEASAGTVSLSKLSFINLGNANTGGGGFGANAALRVHGTAVVTLDAGAGNPLVMGTGVQVGTLVFDSAQLTLNGGTLQPTGACGGGCVAQLKVGGTAQLVLDGTVVALSTTSDVLPQPMGLVSDSGSLTIRNASLSQSGSSTPRDLVIANATSTVTLANSTVTSTFHNIVGFQNGTPTANLQNLTVSGAVGRVAGPTFSQAGPSPTINVTGGNYSNITGVNGFNATVLDVSTGAAGTINITGGTFTNNQNVVDLSGSGARNLRVRGSTFSGNSTCGGGCFTFLLGGDASSVFDLGTAVDLGANTIQAIASGRGVAVNTNAAITVNAVGNTWKAGIQGANSSGQYSLGTAPCGTSSCSISTGTGANYTVTSGAIRLAGN